MEERLARIEALLERLVLLMEREIEDEDDTPIPFVLTTKGREAVKEDK